MDWRWGEETEKWGGIRDFEPEKRKRERSSGGHQSNPLCCKQSVPLESVVGGTISKNTKQG